MKKHILLLGIFLNLTFSLSVQAGNTVIDSLKQEIRQAEREPSSKEKLIELYQFLGAEYETLDHDSSYHYIQKGLSLFTRDLPLRKKATCNCSTHWPTIFSWRES